MKTLFTILFILSSFCIKAQVTPVYFYRDKITTDRNKATSYAIYGKLTNEDLWVFKRYDLANNLMQTGSYKDEGLSVPHGKFIFYMDIEVFNEWNKTNFSIKGKTRFISQMGTFNDGLEQGRWLLFFPDGNVFTSMDFVNGKLHGEYVKYDKIGRSEIRGNYVDGEKDGEWILTKQNMIETYEKGVLKSKVKIPKPPKV